MLKRIVSHIRSLKVDRRANVAMMTAFFALPLFGMMGLAMDYALAVSTKSKLDMAADAAAISAITKAQTIITGNSGMTGSALTDGQAQGKSVFKANAGAINFADLPDPVVSVTRNGQVLSASVSYATASHNSFGGMFGSSATQVHGTVASSLQMSKYINIYLVVDVSQSMGIAATPADMSAMFRLTGCVFGCHLPTRPGPSNQQIAQNAHIPLRIDVIRDAVIDMIGQVKATTIGVPTVDIGIYTMEMNLNTLVPPTNSYSTLQAVASGLNLGPDNDHGQSADSYTQTALDNLANIVPSSGDGSTPANAQNFIFIMTDGTSDIYDVQSSPFFHDFDTYHSYWNSIINLKKNATIGVIYTTYYELYANNDPSQGFEQNYNNTIRSIHKDIQPNLMQVATTPGWFIEATDQTSINMALNKFLLQAMAAARLTN